MQTTVVYTWERDACENGLTMVSMEYWNGRSKRGFMIRMRMQVSYHFTSEEQRSVASDL
jgi:hypothetical protein